MSALSVRLPESLHRKLAEVAKTEGISINQLINSAVAEKMSALMTEEYLQARARQGSKRKFATALAKVADVEPDESDQITTPSVRRSRRRVG
jgi:predicted transcriptional regulator